MFFMAEEKDNRCEQAIDQFTHLRKMLEIIIDLCKDNEIIPRTNTQLSDIKYFVGKGGHNNGSKPKEGVWPPVISSYIWSMTDILQDGSHHVKDLNLHVSEYVVEKKSPFLFRSCLYQIMELIRWLISTRDKIIDGNLRTPLYTIDRTKMERYRKTDKNQRRFASSM